MLVADAETNCIFALLDDTTGMGLFVDVISPIFLFALLGGVLPLRCLLIKVLKFDSATGLTFGRHLEQSEFGGWGLPLSDAEVSCTDEQEKKESEFRMNQKICIGGDPLLVLENVSGNIKNQCLIKQINELEVYVKIL